MSLSRIFVANRGEIAARIIRACDAEGIETVIGLSTADVSSVPARMAGRVVCIGPGPAADSYLNIDAVITAAVGTGCDALHPGYGFLAENADLSAACAEHGIRFIGPSPMVIGKLGDKISARAEATAAGVPVVPGRSDINDFAAAKTAAASIGFPILLKASAGGGGRGMQVVRSAEQLENAYNTARAEARASFGDDTIYLERYVASARHVEVQVLGDSFGSVVHLGERDCTLQRRHQKIIEEGPATAVPPELVQQMRQAAVELTKSVGYEGAGTVEFIYDQELEEFFFLEVNTRIQVEHPVTEMLTGVDLVAQQIRVAAGAPLALSQDDISLSGHAIECRLNAEQALDGFRPSPGEITKWHVPNRTWFRLDTHCEAGHVVPPFYDSMLAKLIVYGETRAEALARMSEILSEFQVDGIETTLPFLKALIDAPDFHTNTVNTRWVEAQLEDPAFLACIESEANE